MYDNILVPTDGSDGTVETVEHAMAIADCHDAVIHALHVIDRRIYLAAAKDDQDDVMDSLKEEGEEAIEMVVDQISDGSSVATEILDGIPYRDIIEYADEHDIDLIVMGTHGRTGRDRLANMGSVTERVIKNAEIPILIVRIGVDE